MIKKAMIMAAGVGTRLNPLTSKIPKPMVPVANTPIIEIILRHLQNFNINDVIANTHYCAESIHDVFGGKNHLGINFQYIYEKALSGTAGGLKKCENFFDENETFIVISGDALTNVNIKELYEKHKNAGALASMALRKVPEEEVEHFGVVVIDENSRITGFQEKPKQKDAKSNLVNTGIYIFETAIFKYIPENSFYDFAKNVFPSLMANNEIMCGFQIDDYWNDIGTLGQYKSSSFELLDGTANLIMPYSETKKGWLAESSKIGNASIENKIVVGEGSVIEDNVVFKGYNIIGNNCIIKSGSQIKDCILWNDVIIEENVILDNCIIADNVNIKANVKIAKDSIVPHDLVITKPEDLYKETINA